MSDGSDPHTQPPGLTIEEVVRRMDEIAASVSGIVEPAREAINKASQRRRLFGYCMIAASLFCMFWIVVLTIGSLPTIDSVVRVRDGQWVPFVFSMVAHAVVTVAGAWFCYQLLRAGERMVLPTWTSPRTEHLLGIEMPQEGMWALMLRAVIALRSGPPPAAPPDPKNESK